MNRKQTHARHGKRRSQRLWLTGLWLASSLLVASQASAQFARLVGRVTNEADEPIEDVSVTITCADLPDFHVETTTRKNGTFSVTFSEPYHRYSLVFDKEGYQGFQQDVTGTALEIMRITFVMHPAGAEQQTGGGEAPPAPAAAGTNPPAEAVLENPAAKAYNAGVTALRDGDLETARQQLEKAVEADPDLAPAYVALASLAMNQKRYEEAASQAEAALERQPGDLGALTIAHDAYRALGRRKDAEAMNEAIKQVGDQAANARVLYNEGAEAYQGGDMDAALSRFREAIATDPELFEAHHAIASVLFAQGDYQGAIQAAEEALALQPDPRTLKLLFQAYSGAGQREEARQVLDRLVEADETLGAQGLLELGVEKFNADAMDEARLLLETAVELDSSLAQAHYLLGITLMNQGDIPGAKQHLQTFLDLDPQNPDAATAREMLAYLE